MHRDEPADVVQELFADRDVPRPPARARGPRRARGDPRGHRARRSGRSSTRTTCRATWSIAAAGDLDARGSRRRHRGPLRRRVTAAAPLRARPPATTSSPSSSSRRDTEQAQLVLGVTRPRTAIRPTASPWPCSTTSSAGGFPAGSSRRSARPGASPTRSARTAAPTTTPARSPSRSERRPSTPTRCSTCCTRELDRLGAEGITARELEVAKGHLRADMLLSLEDSGSRMSRIGSALLLFGSVLTTEELLGAIAVCHRRRSAMPPPSRC